MICMFVGERNRVVDVYLETWARALAKKVRVVNYEALPLYRRIDAAAYVFTDLERLTDDECRRVGQLARRIRAAGGRILNEPENVLRRYDLLRTLNRAGLNAYNVHRLSDTDPIRYPVFVRREREHNGPLTPLLNDAEELRAALEPLKRSDKHDDDLLIVEYEHTPAADGMFRKYSAMRIGDRIIPRHVLFSGNWVGKLLDVINEPTVEEESAFIDGNPHEADLRRIFDVAKIDYGRIDYAVRDGRVVTWEINTNPVLVPPPEYCNPRRLYAQGQTALAMNNEFKALADGRVARVDAGGLPAVVRDESAERRGFMLVAGLWSALGRAAKGRRAVRLLRRSLNQALDVTHPGPDPT